ncbi:hypothetical protein QTP88_011808 [Uroleucon formosanum]
MSSKNIKNGYQKRKANEKLKLMNIANDPKLKKLCSFVKKEPAESFIQNVIENNDTVHEKLKMSSKDHNDTFISSPEKSAVINTSDIKNDPIMPLPSDRIEFRNRIKQGPFQPLLNIYPQKINKNKRRSFNKNWCFKGNGYNNSQVNSCFSVSGFKSWYRSHERFKKHQLSKVHLNATTSFQNFIKSKSIDCQLNSAQIVVLKKNEERIKNRNIMRRLIDIVHLLGKTGKPFRGHDENILSNQKGMFREIIDLLARYDDVLKIHLLSGPKNAQYMSNRIQNDLISLLHSVMIKKIKSNFENSFISLMADETSDVGHCEQLSVVVRYFNQELNRPVETFVALNKMTSVTGQSIFDSINIVLKMINKDWSSVLAVCFDGASSMSGNVGGVQAKCKEQNDKILYVHCYAHCLNLVLIDSICENSSTPNNRLIFNFLGTIQFIYNFIEGSPMRHAILQKVALEAGSHLKSLKSCSITHWACRSEAVSAVKNNYSILIVAIDEICKNCTVPCMKTKGIGLFHQLQSFEFLLGLHLMEPILKMILKVSSGLQSQKLDLLTAINSIQALKSSLIFMRNDIFFKNIFEEVTAKCIDLDISIPAVKRKKASVRLDENYSNQFFYDSKYEKLRCSVFNLLIDNLINGLSIRFHQDGLDLISAVGNLLKLKLNNSYSNILSKLFNISIDEMEVEIKILKHMPGVPSGTSSESVYMWLDWLKESGQLNIFNNMYLALKMFTIVMS